MGAIHTSFPGFVPDTGPPFEAGFVFLGQALRATTAHTEAAAKRRLRHKIW